MINSKNNLLSDASLRKLIIKMSEFPIYLETSRTDVPGISDCIEEIFSLLGTEDIGEIIAAAVEEELITQEQGCEFLGIAMWSGQTNGAQLQPTIEHWLEDANDPIRINLALAQSVFPFANIELMTKVLERVSQRFPKYTDICRGIIHRRREQGL